MTDREIERHVARLVAGRVAVRAGGVRYLAGRPSREARLLACEYEDEAYRRATLEGCMTRAEGEARLRALGLWRGEDDELLAALGEKVPKLQVDLYEARDDEGRLGGIRRVLADVRRDAAALEARKAYFEPRTAEHAALHARTYFLVGASLVTLAGEPHWPDPDAGWGEPDLVVEEAVAAVVAARLTPAGIREVARSNRWRACWSARHVARGLIDAAAVDLDDETNSLLHWSEMYENAARLEDPPPESVLADDDMFDGWLTLRRGASEDARLRREYRKMTRGNARIEGAGEVFLVRDEKNAEDVSKIMDRFMDPEAKRTKAEALAYVRANEDVKESQLPHVDRANRMRFAAWQADQNHQRRR